MARKSILRLARYAPRDGRVFLGIERPPFETKTFYSTFRWNADVGDFRKAIERGEVQRAIGARYGVSQTLVSAIKRGRLWNE